MVSFGNRRGVTDLWNKEWNSHQVLLGDQKATRGKNGPVFNVKSSDIFKPHCSHLAPLEGFSLFLPWKMHESVNTEHPACLELWL